jgi:hypothetical protein
MLICEEFRTARGQFNQLGGFNQALLASGEVLGNRSQKQFLRSVPLCTKLIELCAVSPTVELVDLVGIYPTRYLVTLCLEPTWNLAGIDLLSVGDFALMTAQELSSNPLEVRNLPHQQ